MFDLCSEPEPPTVLLIDDDMVSREVVATLLTMSGYVVHTAEHGTAAVAMLKGGECAPAAILVDAQMPGLSGTELFAALRACSKASVIAISGSQPPDEVKTAADGFLLKPFGARELSALLAGQAARRTAPGSANAEDRDAGAIVDPQVLAQLRDMMPASGVRQIYSAIVVDLGRRMKALEAAIARGDSTEVRRIGHAIKGSCAMAGALGAARLGALIEQGMLDRNSNQFDNSTRLLTDLKAAAVNLERMLEAEFPA